MGTRGGFLLVRVPSLPTSSFCHMLEVAWARIPWLTQRVISTIDARSGTRSATSVGVTGWLIYPLDPLFNQLATSRGGCGVAFSIIYWLDPHFLPKATPEGQFEVAGDALDSLSGTRRAQFYLAGACLSGIPSGQSASWDGQCIFVACDGHSGVAFVNNLWASVCCGGHAEHFRAA